MVESRGQGAERDWRYDGPEIIADGVVHGLGLALAVVGTVTLLGLLIMQRGDASMTAAHAVYCATLLVTLGASAAYNLWPVSPVKWVLRRVDHAMIFGLIAGTYTPFLARIGSIETNLMLAAIWIASLGGMVLKLLDIGRREWLATVLYLAVGWSGIATLGLIVASLPGTSLALLLTGGGLYSGGVAFHHWRGLRFQNAIWHAFVLGGAVCHFLAILVALYGR